MSRKKNETQRRLDKLRAIRQKADRELAVLASAMGERIGIEADVKLLAVLEGSGSLPAPGGPDLPASTQMIAAIRLGLQRSGRLIERSEVVDLKRPLRDSTEAELIAEMDGRAEGKD